MTLVRNRSNHRKNFRTNPPDWSALVPVLPGRGPRTRRLYDAVRRLIEGGQVPPGAKLPTTRDLASRLGMSRGAAVSAFEMLVADGFAVARVGAGTFVADQVPLVPDTPAPIALVAEEDRPMPGALAVAFADARTLSAFRRLLSRRLATPDPGHFHYGDPRGGRELREAIAAYLRTARGVRCDAGQIVVTSGTQQGLALFLRAVVRPDDPVWIEDPGYGRALAAILAAGARPIGVPVDREGLDPWRGEALCPSARAVYVTPSHQFPLGVSLSMRRRLALLDWARRGGAWIIEDDYDSEFRYAGPPLTALQGLDGSGRVAYLGTFSKVLAPGLRVGYLVVPDKLLGAVVDLRVRMDRQPPTLAEGALADLLNEGHFSAHLRRARIRARQSRDALVEGLRDGTDGRLAVDSPEQGLHLVARPAAPSIDSELLPRMAQAGLGGRALSEMFLSRPPEQGLVLGFSGFAPDELKAAGRRLGTLLRQPSPP